MRYKLLILIFALTVLPISISAQEVTSQNIVANPDTTVSEPTRSDALNIFLDCMMCDRTYLKETFPYVNWVNDRKQADVHIIMSYRTTGSGGSENIATFTGLQAYTGLNDTLTYFTPPNATRDFTRKGQANLIAMGLMRYVARTPLANNMSIVYQEPAGTKKISSVVEGDPWNSWIFRISSRGSYSKSDTYEDINYSGSFTADRITPEWKSETDASFNVNQENTTYNGVTKGYSNNSWGVRSQLVKSLGDHWSAGGGADLTNSLKVNKKLSMQLDPTVEYNIYPYAESYNRQIRIKYSFPLEQVTYYDTSMFFKKEEFIARQRLAVAIGFNQKWGSANFSLTGSHILNDLKSHSVSMSGEVNWRVVKGLSINMSARGGVTKDQRWMPLKGMTLEETLLRIKSTNSKYSYSMSFGLTYTFGSMYNNVVNPRFGSGGGGR